MRIRDEIEKRGLPQEYIVRALISIFLTGIWGVIGACAFFNCQNQ